MRKLILLLAMAMLLTVPAWAAAEPEEIPPEPDGSPHRFDITVIREATCAEKGLLAYTCSRCGLTYIGEVPPTGHHDYAVTRTEPTCTEAGSAQHVCARCGDAYTETLPALGHDYAYQYDAEFDQAGAILSCGTWLCSRCGHVLAASEGNVLYYYELEPTPAEGPGPAVPQARTGLWAVLCIAALLVLAAEAALLLRSMDKDRPVR